MTRLEQDIDITHRWCVGVLTNDGRVFARTSHETFDTQDRAEAYAAKRGAQKRFMHFVVRPALMDPRPGEIVSLRSVA